MDAAPTTSHDEPGMDLTPNGTRRSWLPDPWAKTSIPGLGHSWIVCSPLQSASRALLLVLLPLIHSCFKFRGANPSPLSGTKLQRISDNPVQKD
ncbi:hypothetical protein ACP4OV_008135 [Aristida adscensionis]